jgi:hypothetical protein
LRAFSLWADLEDGVVLSLTEIRCYTHGRQERGRDDRAHRALLYSFPCTC